MKMYRKMRNINKMRSNPSRASRILATRGVEYAKSLSVSVPKIFSGSKGIVLIRCDLLYLLKLLYQRHEGSTPMVN